MTFFFFGRGEGGGFVLNIAFGSTSLPTTNLVFLFIARIRFTATDSLIGVLRKIYGRELVKEIRTVKKIDFRHKKAILDLDFSISCGQK